MSSALRLALPVLASACLATLSACRGQPTKESPIHLVGDMDWQEKYESQEASPFFGDGRANRPLPDGVVAHSMGFHGDPARSAKARADALKDDDAFYRGRNASGQLVKVAPIEVNEAVMRRGQERFNVFCAPCHDKTGGGDGAVMQRGYLGPVTEDGKYTKPIALAERVPQIGDGELFQVISNGKGNMPSYRKQIPEADRWAIVAWLRVLARSQRTTVDDVPADKRGSIDPESGTP